MRGHLERVCDHAGVLRLGGAYGEPYEWAATIRAVTPDWQDVEVMGVHGQVTREIWRGVVRVLVHEGVRTMRFTRRGAHSRERVIQIQP